ncbi:MAG: HD-GYP domain-containing protein [Clostridium sp.]
MNENEVLLEVQELKKGMVISKDVIKNGSVLLRRGTVLTDELIEKLNRICFLEKIEVNVSDRVIAESSKEMEIKIVEESFRQVSSELEQMFSKINKIRKTNVDELRIFAEKIQKQFKSTEAVVGTVVFRGSGSDNIYRHGVNVAVLSALIGRWVGLETSKINLLIYSALLHDFGITKLDSKYQRKPDIILEKNYKEVREHVTISYRYVEDIPYLDKSVSYGVVMHHEREDGSGYPLGIKGDKIHYFAKIIAIADELDVLNSYKEDSVNRGPFEILEELKRKSLSKLDYKYTKTLLEHVANYYMGESVVLSTGEVAKIIQVDSENLSKPLLLKDGEFLDLSKNKDVYIKNILLD